MAEEKETPKTIQTVGGIKGRKTIYQPVDEEGKPLIYSEEASAAPTTYDKTGKKVVKGSKTGKVVDTEA